jgi:hypothetical protein
MSEDEIIGTFEHWIEYEKANKDKINKADELIEIQQGLLDLYKQEKEKNKELEKEMELNKEAIYLANNTICNYDIGYQDALNKKMTATEIVAERRKFMILGQKINQLENANYELHKKIDEGNKKVVEDYISKDKIREYRKQFIKDNKKEKTFMTQSSQINASLIKFCEALLLEEE